jgi:hypothetical protein
MALPKPSVTRPEIVNVGATEVDPYASSCGKKITSSSKPDSKTHLPTLDAKVIAFGLAEGVENSKRKNGKAQRIVRITSSW